MRLGAASVFVTAMTKPGSTPLRALLWAVNRGRTPEPLAAAPGTAASVPLAVQPASLLHGRLGESAGESLCLALGYRRLERKGQDLAIRADALERLAVGARKLAAQGAFAATPALRRLSGCDDEGLELALGALGYAARQDQDGLAFAPRARRGNGTAAAKPRKNQGRRSAKARRDSPFAKLRELKLP